MKIFKSTILLIVFLAGCSSNEGLTSFGKRKYSKGYFADVPAEKPGVLNKAGNNKVKVENSTALSIENKTELKEPAKSSVPLKEAIASNKKTEHSETQKYFRAVVNKTAKVNDDKPLGDHIAKPLKAWQILFIIALSIVLLIIIIPAIHGIVATLLFVLALILLVIALCIIPKNNPEGNTGSNQSYVRQDGQHESQNTSNAADIVLGILLIVLGLIFGFVSALVILSAAVGGGISSSIIALAGVVLLLSLLAIIGGIILCAIAPSGKTTKTNNTTGNRR
ncbi:MAG TPA: hypothetical protein VK890_06525 [Bacteroidia bacterium]|nr:hypothetical protein [Bacteroidia bacterium]